MSVYLTPPLICINNRNNKSGPSLTKITPHYQQRLLPLTLVHHNEGKDSTVVLVLFFGVASKTSVLASILKGDVPQQDGHIVFMVLPHKVHPLSIYLHMWIWILRYDHWVTHLITPESTNHPKPQNLNISLSLRNRFLPYAWCRCHWTASWNKGCQYRYSWRTYKAT